MTLEANDTNFERESTPPHTNPITSHIIMRFQFYNDVLYPVDPSFLSEIGHNRFGRLFGHYAYLGEKFRTLIQETDGGTPIEQAERIGWGQSDEAVEALIPVSSINREYEFLYGQLALRTAVGDGARKRTQQRRDEFDFKTGMNEGALEEAAALLRTFGLTNYHLDLLQQRVDGIVQKHGIEGLKTYLKQFEAEHTHHK